VSARRWNPYSAQEYPPGSQIEDSKVSGYVVFYQIQENYSSHLE
jgi:hypothetical protein